MRRFLMGGGRSSGSKYGAKATIVDGIRFDSLREAARYGELKLLEKAGVISGLRIHPAYELTVNGFRVCRYVADFEYVEDGQTIIEDVKGVKTAVYQLKRKLMQAVYGVEIRETG